MQYSRGTMKKVSKNLRALLLEFWTFLKEWGQFWFKYLYKVFAGFEWVKDLVAKVLYKQRGRFSRPFVHIAMGALVAAGLTLAPVLAQSFPGVAPDPWTADAPSSGVREITDDGTATQISDKVRDKIQDYKVQPGDTVSSIAVQFGIDTDTIKWQNDLPSLNSIKPGQTLQILPVTGVAHKVVRGETIYSIAKKYSANAQAIVDFPFNTFADDETFALSVGQTLIVPDGTKPNTIPTNPSIYVTQRTPNAGSVSGTGNFAWPISGLITQRFSWYHSGVDIATAFGTPVLAADSGRVIVAGWTDNTGYGNRVMIDHGNGYVTLYGHMSRIDVVVGQTVARGNQLGLEGSTGRSTGPHLHFEIRRNGKVTDPLGYLR